MKKVFFLVSLSVILFSCKTAEMYELSDGTFITKRKADRISKRIINREFRKLSKQEQEDVMMIVVDTTQNN
jgi:hypothetical protein